MLQKKHEENVAKAKAALEAAKKKYEQEVQLRIKAKKEQEEKQRKLAGILVSKYLPDWDEYSKAELSAIFRTAFMSRECSELLLMIHEGTWKDDTETDHSTSLFPTTTQETSLDNELSFMEEFLDEE